MRHLKSMSIEELIDREEEFRLSNHEENSGLWREKIAVLDELFRKIKSDKDSEYIHSLENIKKQLIYNLVHYGTYLKMETQKDDFAAKRTLTKALNYDRTNPVARYRLGFIAYKEKNYMESTLHFQAALQPQSKISHAEYNLTPQQIYNATLYLSNSALYIAKEAQESLEKIDGDVNKAGVANVEMSPLYEIIANNEEYLHHHAFTMTSQEGEKLCSKEECEIVIDSNLPDTLILYFSDREHTIFYNGGEASLSINQAEMLRYFMLHSSEESPTAKNPFYDLFNPVNDHGEFKPTAFRKAVNRLKEKLGNAGVPESSVINKRHQNETAYYYNQTIPFLLMYRIDHTFILSQ